MHYLVALVINVVLILHRASARVRVKPFLQKPVYLYRAGGAVFKRTKHLNAVGSTADEFCGTLHHIGGFIGNQFGVGCGNVEEIAGFIVENRHFSAIDRMRVCHDKTFLRLAVNLIELNRSDRARTHDVRQNVSSAHAGQLVFVAHKHQSCACGYFLEKSLEQKYVNHGKLVHDNDVAGKIFTACHIRTEPARPVNRTCLSSRSLAHSFGGSSRRRHQKNGLIKFIENFYNAFDYGGFARTRSARNKRCAVAYCRGNRFLLSFVQNYAVDFLVFRYIRSNVVYGGIRALQKPSHKHGGVFFGTVNARQGEHFFAVYF